MWRNCELSHFANSTSGIGRGLSSIKVAIGFVAYSGLFTLAHYHAGDLFLPISIRTMLPVFISFSDSYVKHDCFVELFSSSLPRNTA